MPEYLTWRFGACPVCLHTCIRPVICPVQCLVYPASGACILPVFVNVPILASVALSCPVLWSCVATMPVLYTYLYVYQYLHQLLCPACPVVQ